MTVHLINPSDFSFGTGFMAPRWLYVLAAATPERFGSPRVTDETLDPFDASAIRTGDVVGIGIHTGNALRGYAIGRADQSQYETLRALRAERFELMDRLAQFPDDMVFFTQITMEAAEDPRPTAPASSDRRSGRGGSPNRAAGCLRGRRCPTCRCRRDHDLHWRGRCLCGTEIERGFRKTASGSCGNVSAFAN